MPHVKFRTQAFLSVIDLLTTSLQELIDVYKEVDGRFGFLEKLDDIEPEEI